MRSRWALLVTALLLAGCLQGAPGSLSDGPAAPPRTANDGPDNRAADPSPFTLPEEPERVWYPVAPPFRWDAAADAAGKTVNAAGAAPCGWPMLGSPERSSKPFAPTDPDLAGAAVLLRAQVDADPRLGWAYHGVLMPHGRPAGTALVEPVGFPLPPAGPSSAVGPRLVAACTGEGSGTEARWTARTHLTLMRGVPGPEVPYRLTVPAGATGLLARPFLWEGSDGALAHFTLLDGNGALQGHYGTSRAEPVTQIPVREGTYTLLVDHAAGGFLQFALDRPGGNLTPVPFLVEDLVLGAGAGSREVALPSGLLAVLPAFRTANVTGEAAWAGVEMTLQGAAQPVFTWRPADGAVRAGLQGRSFSPDAFTREEFRWDHHAVASGPHRLQVEADRLDAEVFLRLYRVAPP
ncbi:MAG TPA: hypothetical protein VNZ52_11655 [Candidatus Thermoplasmatota archaeon]|nr:hypothetical protein [Candidatus Thermoplasmatota archaeon]